MTDPISGSTRPLLIVLSAPSGAGKTTLRERLLADRPDIAYSVSCTTRPPRGQEVNGRDYHFLTMADFERLIAERAFLEYARVHGSCYGTLRRNISDSFEQGQSVLMDIDVAGARQVRRALAALPPDSVLRNGLVDIFISPPSMEELRARLTRRGEDAAEVIEERLRNAVGEMAAAQEYRYRLINDSLERAYAELLSIVRKEERRT